MGKDDSRSGLTRREMLRLSATAGAGIAFLNWPNANPEGKQTAADAKQNNSLYADLLTTWCDGMIARQATAMREPALYGGLLCPACVLIHGRCGDAVYPFLRMARSTGNSKYLDAALRVHEWTEQQVSRPDGSWVNDVNLSSWKGITVFHAIALAEALHHHGELLDTDTRRKWTDRLVRAVKFLDGFITIETGNINYPVTSSYCLALCSQVLGDSHLRDRARQLAHTSLDYFTPNGILYGEGHPLKAVTRKGCRPVDLGYNVEESLPALAMYALATNDQQVLDRVITGMRTHMEFMVPDGAWDNSWGSRNYKWTWWGSRTSDGCHPAFVLLAQHEPKFREVAWRNLELMATCTHDGLLYGGPHYFAHGDLPCIHHTFTHAKALATVLDRAGSDLVRGQKLALPRDEAYGLKTFPEIGTRLAAIGDWRVTVTENDWEYVEHVQAGGAGAGGGHASGGAVSLLYHRALGPILTASMTEYQALEISNQQAHRDYPHMTLTPRIECKSDLTYTSLSDFEAVLTATSSPDEIVFHARGGLLTASHQPIPKNEVGYLLSYRFTAAKVEIVAAVDQAGPAPLQFILPVISHHEEKVGTPDPKTLRIAKNKSALIVRTDAPDGFGTVPSERTFNLVPGFECLPLRVTLQPGKDVRIELSAEV